MFSSIDLRFSDSANERLFKQSLEQRLTRSSMVLSFIFCVGSALYLLEDSPPRFASDDPRPTRFCAVVVIFLIIPALVLFASILRLCSIRFKSLNWEIVAVIVPTLVCAVLPWVNEWSIARIYGLEPDEVWGTDKDSRAAEGSVALIIDAVITAVFLFIPIRIHLKALPGLLGCVSFCLSGVIVGSPFPGQLKYNVFTLCMLTFCALWGAHNNERQARESWVAQGEVRLKSDALVQQYLGTSRILDCLCDCLVQLGEDLTIIDPSPRLCALLMCSSAESLRGSNFCDFISSDDDRHYFASQLATISSGVEPQQSGFDGNMMHISLQDTGRREFRAYAYHTSIYGYDGKFGHLIAFVEAQEREAPFNPASDGNLLPLESSGGDDFLNSASRGVGTSCSGTTLTLPPAVCTEEVAAWIDLASEDLSILSCSPSFTALGPIALGTGMVQLLESAEAELREFLQECYNAAANGVDLSRTPTRQLDLQPNPNAKVFFKCVCSPDLCAALPRELEHHDDEKSGTCLMRITLNDLKCYHGRTKQGKHRMPPSRSSRSIGGPQKKRVRL